MSRATTFRDSQYHKIGKLISCAAHTTYRGDNPSHLSKESIPDES
jgi:hypothetical protein